MTLPLNILVIDDCASTRAVLATVVRSAGHSVVVAETAAAAFELLVSQTPDLILTEAGLPDMNAPELVRRLKAHPRCAAALIFTVSVDDTREACVRMAAAGVNGRLAKPICRETLMRLVRAVAWSRSATAAMAGADLLPRLAG